MASNGGNRYAEHHALDQASHDVAQKQRVQRRANVADPGEIRLRHAEDYLQRRTAPAMVRPMGVRMPRRPSEREDRQGESDETNSGSDDLAGRAGRLHVATDLAGHEA